MATVSPQDNNSALVDQSVPQWKRELILRRRALARSLPAGGSSVQLTRPSVVTAVRKAEHEAAAAPESVIGKQPQRAPPVASHKGVLEQDFNPSSRGRVGGGGGGGERAVSPAAAGAAAVGASMRLVEHLADEVLVNGGGGDGGGDAAPGAEAGDEAAPKKMRPALDNAALLGANNNGARAPDDGQSDSSEELEYGPGIVTKLRCKYLSMTLRETQKKGVRPSLVNLRRATSLENMLEADDMDAGKPPIKAQPRFVKKEDVNKANNKPQKMSQHHQRYRGVSRGNDSLKRARSVEALYRNELRNVAMFRCVNRSSKPGLIDINKNNAPVIKPLVNEDIIIVENKDKNNKKAPTDPKAPPSQTQKMRTSTAAPETELPPPDVVKTTMKIFESSQRPRAPYSHKSAAPKGPAKPALPPKLNLEKVQQKPVNKSPRRVVPPAPELRPFSPPRRLLSPDNTPSPPLSPASPTPGAQKLKSPSPTIERKQALFMPKDTLECDPLVTAPVISNGTANADSSSKAQHKAESSDEDACDGENSVKTVPKAVLENIRKDGLSLHFSFDKNSNNSNEKIKSYLPNAKNVIQNDHISTSATFNETPHLKIVSSSNSSNFQQSSKQIGVIRPMVTATNKTSSGVTGRELEKNIINREKLNDQHVNKIIGTKKIDDVIENVNVRDKTSSEKSIVPSKLKSSKSGENAQNIMVFNFSNRKDPPPDYIPDDGLNLVQRNKFRGGGGSVLVLGVAGESSTDDFAGPPSPCDVAFEGANVLINGRSNLRKQPRANKLHISFDDAATTMFEYPPESSLLDYEGEGESEGDGQAAHAASASAPTPGVPVPLGGSSLASYTPSKVHLGSEDFQLGVTRATPASPPVDPVAKASDASSTIAGEEQEEYLKPAEESETVAWSAETAVDLLF